MSRYTLPGCRIVKTTTKMPWSAAPISQPLFLSRRMAGVWRHEGEGIVERRDRLLETDAMLRSVDRGLLYIPLEPHF